MRVLLFGGSFNPPHLGHLIVIQQAFELITAIDELWLLPAYNHTFQKALAPAKHRLNMCRLLATEAAPAKVKVCSIEIDRRTSGSTYETLNLLKNGPYTRQHEYAFLMGSDQLASFEKWQHWQDLLKAMPFYVYPRAGYPMEPLYPNMIPLKSPTQVITNLSSTLVRDRLIQKLSLQHLVPSPILKYLILNTIF